jgi:hypothetical protein
MRHSFAAAAAILLVTPPLSAHGQISSPAIGSGSVTIRPVATRGVSVGGANLGAGGVGVGVGDVFSRAASARDRAPTTSVSRASGCGLRCLHVLYMARASMMTGARATRHPGKSPLCDEGDGTLPADPEGSTTAALNNRL